MFLCEYKLRTCAWRRNLTFANGVSDVIDICGHWSSCGRGEWQLRSDFHRDSPTWLCGVGISHIGFPTQGFPSHSPAGINTSRRRWKLSCSVVRLNKVTFLISCSKTPQQNIHGNLSTVSAVITDMAKPIGAFLGDIQLRTYLKMARIAVISQSMDLTWGLFLLIAVSFLGSYRAYGLHLRLRSWLWRLESLKRHADSLQRKISCFPQSSISLSSSTVS
jgi:hypothetical protein